MSKMTDRQAAEWPRHIERAQKLGANVTADHGYWSMDYAEETRPGRGHYLNAQWNDGEHFVQIVMDVYGYGNLSVAELSWIHGDSDEECECELCAAENAEIEAESPATPTPKEEQ